MNEHLCNMINELWGWSFKSLPNKVKYESIKAIIDTIGVSILGYEYSDIPKRYGEIIGVHLSSGSTILGGWWKTKAIYASSINSFSSHALEYDDWLRPGFVHAGSIVIPSALAYGEEKITWRDFIESVVIGYEAIARIGAAMGREHYKFWHTTGTAGAIASALTISKVLDLDTEQACHASALAGYFTSGLWGFISQGSSIKPYSPAHASLLGGIACELIQNNIRTNTRLFEDERGLKILSRSLKIDILEDPPWKYAILENGYKLYPSCRHTHTAILSAINISKQIDIDKVDEIKIEIFGEALNIASIENPKTVEQARFALKYLVATALKYGRLGFKELENGLTDRDIKRLINISNVVINKEYDRLYPEKQPTRLIIKANGKILEDYQEYPPGDSSNPVSIKEIKNKFYPYISDFSKNVIDRVIKVIHIDRQYNKKIKLLENCQ